MENVQIGARDEATSYTLSVHHNIRLLLALASTGGIYQEKPVTATNQ